MTELVSLSFVNALGKTQAFAWTMRLCLAASLLLISLGLWHWGAVEVRGHLDQVLLLSLLGLAWLFVSLQSFP